MIWKHATPLNNEHHEVTNLPASFVGKSGCFYIRQRRADGKGYLNRCTVWESIDAYNNRTPGKLQFLDTCDTLADFSHEVKIYSESLTTTPPAYEPDRDETDFGLTPERNIWANRFDKAREGRKYAA